MQLPKIPSRLLRPPRGIKRPKVSDFQADMQRLGEDIAEEFKERVKTNIRENTYNFPLAESTKRRKGSSTPLIDTGEMLDSIYRDGTTVSVEDTPRNDSPLTNLELAIVHEYGTKDKHIPARPVWRNTFDDFRKDAKDEVERFFQTKQFKKRRKK